MNERRQGQHRAVHRLAQVYADLVIAVNEIEGLNDCERRHRALCLTREARDVVKYVVDADLGPKLIREE
jgi:hypothetical protein